MLAVGIGLPVTVDALAHYLAVAIDTVARVDGDDIAPRPAGDEVDAGVVLGRDPVVAGTGDDPVGTVPAGEEVRTDSPDDRRTRSGGSDCRQRREEHSDRQARAHH